MDILSYILSKKNNGSNTGGGTGGSGEITHESAYAKLLPKGTFRELDFAEVIPLYIEEFGATLGDVKLYYTNDSSHLGNEVSKISAGSLIIMVLKMNMATMEINISMYGNNGIGLEYNPSNFFENGYYVNVAICVATTDFTPTSGKYISISGFSSVVM